MLVQRLDPAPRSYPKFVHLRRRSDRGDAISPVPMTMAKIEQWLLADAVNEDDLLLLFEGFVWRLVAAGLPLDRASLHVGTLHPQLIGFAWNWNRQDGLCDEVKIDDASRQTDSYKLSPMYRVIGHGELVRENVRDPGAAERFPLMAELANQGIVDYVAMPLRAGGSYHNAATLATKQEGGFSDGQFAELCRLFSLLALHVERHIAQLLAGNVLNTYLGDAAASRVLAGSIKRGSGTLIDAVIWASDMRGFTDLADRLDGNEMIALLNVYFERLAGAVLAHGGEVLKFMGDGLLAVFPFAAFETEDEAAKASLRASEAACGAVAALNSDAPAELREIDGWKPLRTGIALHEGPVFFGNVGAPERLDFTVIGKDVNAASRVEALSKTLERPILITGPVAKRLDRPLDFLGEHRLRGLAEPIAIYSPSQL